MTIGPQTPVLVVDRDRRVSSLVRQFLLEMGLKEIETATDGASALKKLRARRYGLILCDWNMSPMTGLDLLQEVRADERLKSLPFIMLTAAVASGNVIAARSSGVTDYIAKPFTRDTLRKKLAPLLAPSVRPSGRTIL